MSQSLECRRKSLTCLLKQREASGGVDGWRVGDGLPF